MERRKKKIIKLTAFLFLLAASIFVMPQKAFAEENDDVTLPTGDIKPVEPQLDESGIDTYGEDDGEEFSGTEYELYTILEKRVKEAMLAGNEWASVKDLKIRKDTYDLSFYYGYSPYFPSDTYNRVSAWYGNAYYTSLRITNTFGTTEETKKIFNEVDEKLASVYKLVDNSMSEEQKAITIHDYLVSHAEYDLNYKNYTSYGVLMEGRGVCQSYALAYMYIMNHLGIETHLISSRAMNHAWNAVKIGGSYYNVDCTFDDPIYDRFGQARHTYFLRSTEEMENLGHTFDNKPYDCTSTKYSSAFWRAANSPVYFQKQNAYYIKWGNLSRYDLTNSTEETLSQTESFRDTLAQKGNALYYSSKQNIYEYLLKDQTEKTVLNLAEQSITGTISGVRREKNGLEFMVYNSSDGSSTLYSTELEDEPIADGWHKDDNGKWRYYKNGTYLTGWRWINKNWYLLGNDGVMKTGWQKVGNIWYYMNTSGAMQTGWQKINGKWYYMNASGAMQTGWRKINGNWYYLNTSGVMQTSQLLEEKYYVNIDGIMAMSEWKKVDGIWYYFDKDGSMVKNGWKCINNEWYYFKKGEMQKSRWIGDYYVLSSGKMAKSQWIGNYYVGADGKWVKDQGKTA